MFHKSIISTARDDSAKYSELGRTKCRYESSKRTHFPWLQWMLCPATTKTNSGEVRRPSQKQKINCISKSNAKRLFQWGEVSATGNLSNKMASGNKYAFILITYTTLNYVICVQTYVMHTEFLQFQVLTGKTLVKLLALSRNPYSSVFVNHIF